MRSSLRGLTYHCGHLPEKEMATHSSVLAWRIPGTVEPGGLPSMGSHWVGHDWSDLAAAVKAMVFPVVMYGCESWTVKKAEHRRIDAFELWCWRRHLRVPWTARRSNQSILKEISPGCSLEGMMLKLKLQFFGYLMQRVDSLKDSDAGRDWGQEDKGTTKNEMVGWHHRPDAHEFEWIPGVGDKQRGLACCDSWGCKEWDTTEQLNWLTAFWTLVDWGWLHFS